MSIYTYYFTVRLITFTDISPKHPYVHPNYRYIAWYTSVSFYSPVLSAAVSHTFMSKIIFMWSYIVLFLFQVLQHKFSSTLKGQRNNTSSSAHISLRIDRQTQTVIQDTSHAKIFIRPGDQSLTTWWLLSEQFTNHIHYLCHIFISALPFMDTHVTKLSSKVKNLPLFFTLHGKARHWTGQHREFILLPG